MKVKFIKDAVIHVDGLPQTMFAAESEVDLPDASAERWRRRGVAIFLDQLPPDPSAGTVITPAPKLAEQPAASEAAATEPAAPADASAEDGKKKRK